RCCESVFIRSVVSNSQRPAPCKFRQPHQPLQSHAFIAPCRPQFVNAMPANQLPTRGELERITRQLLHFLPILRCLTPVQRKRSRLTLQPDAGKPPHPRFQKRQQRWRKPACGGNTTPVSEAQLCSV